MAHAALIAQATTVRDSQSTSHPIEQHEGWVFYDHDVVNDDHTPWGNDGKKITTRVSLSDNSELDLICAVCEEPLPSNRFFQTDCGHLYCRPCINDLFDDLTHDETQHLPICCAPSIRAVFPRRYQIPKRGWPISYNEPDMDLGCLICTDTLKGKHFVWAACGHCFCELCINKIFQQAAKNESDCPAKCCDRELSIDHAKRLLPAGLEVTYERKMIESKTKDRTYCHNRQCGNFILPLDINNSKATCEFCFQVTCADCKAAVHQGACRPDPDIEALKELADSNGYQQCTQCKRLVELSMGCYHMTCYCGSEFCYKCGSGWKTCGCPQADEAMLYENHGLPEGAMDGIHEHLMAMAEVRRQLENHDIPGPHALAAYADIERQLPDFLLDPNDPGARDGYLQAVIANLRARAARVMPPARIDGADVPDAAQRLPRQAYLLVDMMRRRQADAPEPAGIPAPPAALGPAPGLRNDFRHDARPPPVAAPAIAQPAPVAARTPRVDLVLQHTCFHQGFWARVDIGNSRCQHCRWRPGDYILECSNCRYRACVRCERNVLTPRALQRLAAVQIAARP